MEQVTNSYGGMDLFENTEIKVFSNSSSEVFVKNKRNNVSLRLSDTREGFNISCENAWLIPSAQNTIATVLKHRS